MTSSRGNQYIVIFYDYNTDSIQEIPTNIRNAAEIIDATVPIMSILTTSGHQPNLHIFENEVSSIFKEYLPKNKIKYQLVLLHLHIHNEAKHAIPTFKAYFITCLCASKPKYMAKEWYCFLPQATLTLNFLSNCRFNPKSWAFLIITEHHFTDLKAES